MYLEKLEKQNNNIIFLSHRADSSLIFTQHLNVELNQKETSIVDFKRTIKVKEDSLSLLKIELKNAKLITTVNIPKKRLPENDFVNLSKNFLNKEKEVVQLKNRIKDFKNPLPFTKKCDEFVQDAAEVSMGYDGSMNLDTFIAKWGKDYDLKFAHWNGIYEGGQCGWASRKMTSVDYLGELNDGDWFKFTIKGGCGQNDYSETLNRVIKIIKKNNNYFIDYVIDPSYKSE